MARIAFILILLLWLAQSADPAPAIATGGSVAPWLFLAGHGGLLLAVRLAARRFAQAASADALAPRDRWWNQRMQRVRLLLVLWFGCGVYLLGWPQLLEPLSAATPLETLPLLLGTLPALLTWFALWWAAYPAEQALSRQRALPRAGLPMPEPPTLRQHLVWNLRTNMLFTLAPVLGIFAVRDVAHLVLQRWGAVPTAELDLLVSAGAAVGVLALSPLLLVRILPTRSLPASPLRARLQAACERQRLRYRDIRLWESGGVLANAAVMGVLPQTRYLIISDGVVEAMPAEQTVAVFLHEAAHVAHHHLAWLIVAVAVYALGAEVLDRTLMEWLGAALPALREVPQGLVGLALGLPAFIVFFGAVSRLFERQADLAAARALSRELSDAPLTLQGASVVAEALHNIALLNHLNPARWEWLHGSIDSRCDFVLMAADRPELAARFDRRALWGRVALLLAAFGLALTLAWLAGAI